MTRTQKIALAALALAFATPLALAQGGPGAGPGDGPGGPGGPGAHMGGPPFQEFLFPPQLVLGNQKAIGLTEEQLTQIKALLNETHATMIEAQTQIAGLQEELETVLDNTSVDEAAALALAERVMTIESQVKRSHLGLAIKVKNLLTPEQQQKLAEMPRERGKRGPGGGR